MLPLLVNIGFQVLFHSPPGVLFTFPSRYYALSVTKSYLALEGGPSCFPPDFSCPAVLWVTARCLMVSSTGLLPSLAGLSSPLPLPLDNALCRPATPKSMLFGLGSFPFARRYLGNRFFFLFLRVLRCFSSLGLPSYSYVFTIRYMGFPMCVPTFGNLRITGYVRLPEAYRSLSRPSSAPDAKAFTMRPL